MLYYYYLLMNILNILKKNHKKINKVYKILHKQKLKIQIHILIQVLKKEVFLIITMKFQNKNYYYLKIIEKYMKILNKCFKIMIEMML